MAQPYMNPNYYNPYQQQVQPPMDRLAQLQAQQYQMMPTQMSGASQPPQTNQGLLWVQGEAGAKSYLVAPNTTVLLMDSDESVFYLKSADSTGMPSLRVFAYSEVTGGGKVENVMKKNKEFVEREEFENFKNEILEKIKPPQTTKTRKSNTDAQE